MTSTSRGALAVAAAAAAAAIASSFPSTVTLIAVPAVPAAALVVPVKVRSGEPTMRIGEHRVIASGISYSKK